MRWFLQLLKQWTRSDEELSKETLVPYHTLLYAGIAA